MTRMNEMRMTKRKKKMSKKERMRMKRRTIKKAINSFNFEIEPFFQQREV